MNLLFAKCRSPYFSRLKKVHEIKLNLLIVICKVYLHVPILHVTGASLSSQVYECSVILLACNKIVYLVAINITHSLTVGPLFFKADADGCLVTPDLTVIPFSSSSTGN